MELRKLFGRQEKAGGAVTKVERPKFSPHQRKALALCEWAAGIEATIPGDQGVFDMFLIEFGGRCLVVTSETARDDRKALEDLAMGWGFEGGIAEARQVVETMRSAQPTPID